MSGPLQTPFDSIENAHQYIRLLLDAIIEAKGEIEADVSITAQANSDRRLEALRLVQFKLDKLERHLHNSSRLLNDLRTLRRLLLERVEVPVANAKLEG